MAAEGLARKKRIRAGHRGVVTKRKGETEMLIARDDPDPVQVGILIFILEDKLKVLQKLDGDILDLIESEPDILSDIEASDAYNQDILLRLQQIKKALPISGIGSVQKGTGRGVSPTSIRQACLPKLTLRPFHGNVFNWLSFWEMYDSAVHSSPHLTDIQKSSYLKSLVEGPAWESMKGLSLMGESYKEALEILTKRFGNKQRIIDKHMNLLLNIEGVASAGNIPALRQLYDSIETNMRALKSLGVVESSYGTLLSSVLVQRLPQELRLIVSRGVAEEWNLTSIMKVFGQELEARERMVTPQGGGVPEGSHKQKSYRPSVSPLITSQGQGQDNGSHSCCYCQ